MTDFALQRKNMVESQIRPSDITDRRIIRAMAHLPREVFVPMAAQAIAYSEEAIELGAGSDPERRAMLPPRTLAAMIQMLSLADQARALVIGGGTGYAAAVLAGMDMTVFALEQTDALASEAARCLSAAGVTGVRLVTGPLVQGHPAGAPYDAILIEGAVGDVPVDLLDQVKDEGRLVAIRLERGVGRATVWRRSGTVFSARAVRDASGPLVAGFEPKRVFEF